MVSAGRGALKTEATTHTSESRRRREVSEREGNHEGNMISGTQPFIQL